MSIQAIVWVMEESRSESTARWVLLTIADNYNEDTENAYPGVRRMAKVARCSERQVYRHLTELEDLGELISTKKPGKVTLYSLPAYRKYLERRKSVTPDIAMSPLSPATPLTLDVTPDIAMSPLTKTGYTPDIPLTKTGYTPDIPLTDPCQDYAQTRTTIETIGTQEPRTLEPLAADAASESDSVGVVGVSSRASGLDYDPITPRPTEELEQTPPSAQPMKDFTDVLAKPKSLDKQKPLIDPVENPDDGWTNFKRRYENANQPIVNKPKTAGKVKAAFRRLHDDDGVDWEIIDQAYREIFEQNDEPDFIDRYVKDIIRRGIVATAPKPWNVPKLTEDERKAQVHAQTSAEDLRRLLKK